MGATRDAGIASRPASPRIPVAGMARSYGARCEGNAVVERPMGATRDAAIAPRPASPRIPVAGMARSYGARCEGNAVVGAPHGRDT